MHIILSNILDKLYEKIQKRIQDDKKRNKQAPGLKHVNTLSNAKHNHDLMQNKNKSKDTGINIL